MMCKLIELMIAICLMSVCISFMGYIYLLIYAQIVELRKESK